MDAQTHFLFEPSVTPRGDGSFIVSPGRPIICEELTPRQAARFLGIERSSVYRLLEAGLLKHRRPSPGKILIDLDDLKRHKRESSDPEFWERRKIPSQP